VRARCSAGRPRDRAAGREHSSREVRGYLVCPHDCGCDDRSHPGCLDLGRDILVGLIDHERATKALRKTGHTGAEASPPSSTRSRSAGPSSRARHDRRHGHDRVPPRRQALGPPATRGSGRSTRPGSRAPRRRSRPTRAFEHPGAGLAVSAPRSEPTPPLPMAQLDEVLLEGDLLRIGETQTGSHRSSLIGRSRTPSPHAREISWVTPTASHLAAASPSGKGGCQSASPRRTGDSAETLQSLHRGGSSHPRAPSRSQG